MKKKQYGNNIKEKKNKTNKNNNKNNKSKSFFLKNNRNKMK